MASRVIVVTSVELGWDCIVEVYNADDIGREELEERYPSKRGYVVHYPQRVLSEVEEE
ncbi:RNA ligase [Pseudomonas phage UNO-G1W1]|jgi:hypothetical protein|uniref:RNA ligase n=1 Tax=Pseudomonas phage UNO-G1W1 TaxID=3136609 RepID=A0AAX4MWE0_9CAUD